MSKANEQRLHDALAAELRAIRGVADISVGAWVAEIPVTHDSVYRVLRGTCPVSVVELVKLCRVVREDPLDVIARAVTRAKGVAY